VETARLESNQRISTLSWNNDGNRLITAGEQIELWGNDSGFGLDSSAANGRASFDVGSSAAASATANWSCLWETRPANPVTYLSFSHDGTLFATAGKHDRLVRVWFQNQQCENCQNMPSVSMSTMFISLCHHIKEDQPIVFL
jgi:WD40 repeat protein